MTPPAEPDAPSPTRKRVVLIVLALLAVVVSVYSGAAQCGFISLDDTSHVTAHPHVRAGLTWEGVRAVFAAPHASLWVPLTTCSLMLDVSLFGLQPVAFHLENVAWHAGAVVILFLALLRLTSRLWESAMVAALFGLHPINVESVVWITERKNVLCAFFAMLTLLAWAHYLQRPRGATWLLAIAAYALALLAKPMAVVLPGVFFLLDFWPNARWRTTKWTCLLREKIPFLVLAFATSRMATWATGPRDALVTISELPLTSRISNAFESVAAYVSQIVWPRGFAILYPHPLEVRLGPALGAAALLLVLSGIALWMRRRQPWLLFGWLWFLGLLVPSLGLVQVGSQARADRFTYLAQIGVFVALVWTASTVWPVSARRLRGVFAGAVLATLAALTMKQTTAWTDSLTLYEHSIGVTGPHPQILDLAATACGSRGDDRAALGYWKQSLAIWSDNAIAWAGIGKTLVRLGAKAEARTAFRRALALDPADAASAEALRQLDKVSPP